MNSDSPGAETCPPILTRLTIPHGSKPCGRVWREMYSFYGRKLNLYVPPSSSSTPPPPRHTLLRVCRGPDRPTSRSSGVFCKLVIVYARVCSTLPPMQQRNVSCSPIQSFCGAKPYFADEISNIQLLAGGEGAKRS